MLNSHMTTQLKDAVAAGSVLYADEHSNGDVEGFFAKVEKAKGTRHATTRLDHPTRKGLDDEDDGDASAGDEYFVISGDARTGSQEHFYLETQAAIAYPRGEHGEIDIICSAQVRIFKDILSCAINNGFDSGEH
jgi:xanthine dehydrogenase molybdopterin-binding subunit B